MKSIPLSFVLLFSIKEKSFENIEICYHIHLKNKLCLKGIYRKHTWILQLSFRKDFYPTPRVSRVKQALLLKYYLFSFAPLGFLRWVELWRSLSFNNINSICFNMKTLNATTLILWFFWWTEIESIMQILALSICVTLRLLSLSHPRASVEGNKQKK